MTKWILICLIMLVGGADLLLAQHVPSDERADATLRRKTDIDGNNIRATIFNTGLTGRSSAVPDEVAYEWPKNSQDEYIAITTIWMGAQLDSLLVGGDPTDPLRVVDLVQYRQAPDGRSWNLEPVPGYSDPNYLVAPNGDPKVGIAKSIDPLSWPPTGWADKFDDNTDPGWIGSWNGFFGKDVFNADQELFYKTGDDLYDRPLGLFQPDATDPTRGGMGMLIDQRVMAWSQVLVSDVIYVVNNVLNDGTNNLKKAATTIWLADAIGNDSQNDRISYSLFSDIAFMDDDEVGFGTAGVVFLETPGNAIDRVDNDGDALEDGSPIVSEMLIAGEDRTNQVDDNGNGLIDENESHIPFGTQEGVTYADYIDNDADGESGSPLVTAVMVGQASGDVWKRWPPNPEGDPIQNGAVHLLMVEGEDEGLPYRDNIDNNGNGEDSSSVVTQAMIDQAASDLYRRYAVPGGRVVLYDLDQTDLGKIYADGIDNNGDGAIDEGIDEGIDEMVDESRDDFVDNDGDWDPISDDVGLDGVEGTGDFGEGDGKPTSGSGTGLPGEPNIDKTDVSESDQLGITNVQRLSAGSIDFSVRSDRFFWLTMMLPGDFFILEPGQQEEGDNDLFVSSSIFPMKSGNTERISYAVIMGEDTLDVLQKRNRAQETYNADYQFAKAPITPKLFAYPGDGQVTLYWDSEAEKSFDSFLAKLGLDGNDFEGYRLYRSQDPAFEDIFTITNGRGARTFREPIAQFDIIDGRVDFANVDVNGVLYYIGNDTGLKHAFVDTDVENGFTYYYALTAYDYGAEMFDIAPAESPILLTIDATGKANLGQNVVQVVPAAPAAGFQPAQITEFLQVAGGASGEINFEIVDPTLIQADHTYQITFRDTVIEATIDTITTKDFTLVDVTNPAELDTLVAMDTAPRTGLEAPLADGVRVSFVNPALVQVNEEKSTRSREDLLPLQFRVFEEGLDRGQENPADYRIEFGDVGIGTSTEFSYRRNPISTITGPAVPVNFKVFNVTTGQEIPFGFLEFSGSGGVFDADAATQQTDIIAFLEEDINGMQITTWSLKYVTGPILSDPTLSFATNGDEATFVLDKPFLSLDVYEYTTLGATVDNTTATADIDAIRVVPNPYRAASRFETRNPFNRGRGPRAIQFTRLPNECTIRIFTVSGELIETIEHRSSNSNGIATWDLLTKDNLDVSYGVYVYHVDAPGVGEKVGKFAIIK
ncbi:MAG: hypothetical protein ACRBF0_20880 [Calditrichia bacterium]